MKTFAQHILREDRIQDLIIAMLKYKKAYAGTKDPDADHNAKMAARMAAAHHLDLDKLQKDHVDNWEPGKCPHCHGLGQIDSKPDLFCAGTGLQGMSDVQAKWFIQTSKELEQLEDDSHRTDWYKKHGDPIKVPDTKLAKDIIKAAVRVGVPNADKMLEPPGHDTEDHIYHSEYYQGHEQDFYLHQMGGLLYQIAKKTAEKHGWKPMPWDKA
jgi:hypothetical protein